MSPTRLTLSLDHIWLISLVKSEGNICECGSAIGGKCVVLGQLVQYAAAALGISRLWLSKCVRLLGSRLRLLGSSDAGCELQLLVLRRVRRRRLFHFVAARQLVLWWRLSSEVGTRLNVILVRSRGSLVVGVGHIGGGGSGNSWALGNWRLHELLAPGLLLWLILGLSLFVLLVLRLGDTLRSWTGCWISNASDLRE